MSSDPDENTPPAQDPTAVTSWRGALAVALGALGLALASLLLAIAS